MQSRVAWLAGFAVLPFTLLGPPEAEACGGTFCDSGPTSMPVDQTGENILFILDGQNVEAHIQIQYDPEADADKFAWVIPMQVVPEFSVGSEALFQNLLAGTVPTYGYNTFSESCGDPGGDSGGTGDGDGDPGDGDGDGDGDPMVVFQDIVGAYEIAVLQGGTIEGVMTWLGDNGYQQDPAAEPVLGEYLAEGFLFVALKLGMNADISEIHPIVLKYQGNEPCVPLRLTRIAAVDDMDVRVFFLSDARAVPTNYRHVLVNPLKINWMALGSNYKEVVSLAVDAAGAEGNAFVTEYAGTSGTVSQSGIVGPGWDAAPFLAMQGTPELVGPELEAQGLMACADDGLGNINCEIHPLVEGLLAQYLPVPNGVTPGDFYSCLVCYAGLIDDVAWNAAEFGAAIDERVVQPGLHAAELLNSWSYVTRMFTTISPNEMLIDPIFHTNPDLPDVDNVQIGTRELLCNGGAVFTLPDGREVFMPAPSIWPEIIGADEMPWEEDVEQAVMVGPNQNLSDQTPLINQLLSEWNEQNGWPPNGGDGDGDGGTTGDGDGDGTSGGDTSGDGTAGTAGDGTGDAGFDDEGASCACSSQEDPRGEMGGMALFGLLGLGLSWRLRQRD
jgi:MYXO-CTERM domain-containing protein